MIIFKQLKWNNFFSYATGNKIDFTEAPLTQLVGLNGAGKTSIALIIQEILYGKNVKKIVKANLKNRNVSGNIFAELDFSVDGVEYKVILERGSKVSISLYKEGEDISSHTTPATMKTLEGILNLDFETFSQLIYQSSKSSLQFLTATDTQRKRFLITLFNLEKYLDIFEQLKIVFTDLNKQLSEVQGKYSVYEDWIDSNKNANLEEKELLPFLSVDTEMIDSLNNLRQKKQEYLSINKKINMNNQYISELQNIDMSLVTKQLHNPEGISELRNTLSEIRFSKSEKLKTLKNAEGKKPFCPVCKQPIDISDSKKLAEKTRAEIEILDLEFTKTSAQLKNLEELQREDENIQKVRAEFEKLNSLIDNSLDTKLIDIDELNKEIADLEHEISKERELSEKRAKENEAIASHNSLVKAKRQQLKEYKDKLNIELNKMEELFDTINQVEILKEAFSTNGLISYKLEFLVKDLELVINEYLQELSRGKFQLNFILKGDKLNIEISDDGKIITINELSEGELSKVNVATLLAIRKLMQQLSNTKLNLLFLDEIMGVLDNYGREDLVDILLKENTLNTFLVSHEYTHPLVPTLNIVKEDAVSRIEYG